jgi:P21-Rho-binding domain
MFWFNRSTAISPVGSRESTGWWTNRQRALVAASHGHGPKYYQGEDLKLFEYKGTVLQIGEKTEPKKQSEKEHRDTTTHKSAHGEGSHSLSVLNQKSLDSTQHSRETQHDSNNRASLCYRHSQQKPPHAEPDDHELQEEKKMQQKQTLKILEGESTGPDNSSIFEGLSTPIPELELSRYGSKSSISASSKQLFVQHQDQQQPRQLFYTPAIAVSTAEPTASPSANRRPPIPAHHFSSPTYITSTHSTSSASPTRSDPPATHRSLSAVQALRSRAVGKVINSNDPTFGRVSLVQAAAPPSAAQAQSSLPLSLWPTSNPLIPASQYNTEMESQPGANDSRNSKQSQRRPKRLTKGPPPAASSANNLPFFNSASSSFSQNNSNTATHHQSLKASASSSSLKRTPSAPVYRSYGNSFSQHQRGPSSPNPLAYASSNSSLDRQISGSTPAFNGTEFGSTALSPPPSQTLPYRQQSHSIKGSEDQVGEPIYGLGVSGPFDSSPDQASLSRNNTQLSSSNLSSPSRGNTLSKMTTPVLQQNNFTSPAAADATQTLRDEKQINLVPIKTRPNSDESKGPTFLGNTGRKKSGFSNFMSGLVGTPRKVQISAPENPVHVTHVGYDNESGQFTVNKFKFLCQVSASMLTCSL